MALHASERTPKLLDPCKAAKLAETREERRLHRELCRTDPTDVLVLLEVLASKPKREERKTREV